MYDWADTFFNVADVACPVREKSDSHTKSPAYYTIKDRLNTSKLNPPITTAFIIYDEKIKVQMPQQYSPYENLTRDLTE